MFCKKIRCSVFIFALFLLCARCETLPSEEKSNFDAQMWEFSDVTFNEMMYLAPSKDPDLLYLVGNAWRLVKGTLVVSTNVVFLPELLILANAWAVHEKVRTDLGKVTVESANLYFVNREKTTLNLIALDILGEQVQSYSFENIEVDNWTKIVTAQDKVIISTSAKKNPRLCTFHTTLFKGKLDCVKVAPKYLADVIQLRDTQLILTTLVPIGPDFILLKHVVFHEIGEELSPSLSLNLDMETSDEFKVFNFYSDRTENLYTIDSVMHFNYFSVIRANKSDPEVLFQSRIDGELVYLNIYAILGLSTNNSTLFVDGISLQFAKSGRAFCMIGIYTGIVDTFIIGEDISIAHNLIGDFFVTFSIFDKSRPDNLFYTKTDPKSITVHENYELDSLRFLEVHRYLEGRSSNFTFQEDSEHDSSKANVPHNSLQNPKVSPMSSRQAPVVFFEYPITKIVLNSNKVVLNSNFSFSKTENVSLNPMLLSYDDQHLPLRQYELTISDSHQEAELSGLPTLDRNQSLHLVQLTRVYQDEFNWIHLERPIHILLFQCTTGCLSCENRYFCKECRPGMTRIDAGFCVSGWTKFAFPFTLSLTILLFSILIIKYSYHGIKPLIKSSSKSRIPIDTSYYFSCLRFFQKVSFALLLYSECVDIPEESWVNPVLNSLPLFCMPYSGLPLPLLLLFGNFEHAVYWRIAQWYCIGICAFLILFNCYTFLFRANAVDRKRSLRTFGTILKHNSYPITISMVYGLTRVCSGTHTVTDIFVFGTYVFSLPILIFCWISSFYDFSELIIFGTEESKLVQNSLFTTLRLAPYSLAYESLFHITAFLSCAFSFTVIMLVESSSPNSFSTSIAFLSFSVALECFWLLYLLFTLPSTTPYLNPITTIGQCLLIPITCLTFTAITSSHTQFSITQSYYFLTSIVLCCAGHMVTYGLPLYARGWGWVRPKVGRGVRCFGKCLGVMVKAVGTSARQELSEELDTTFNTSLAKEPTENSMEGLLATQNSRNLKISRNKNEVRREELTLEESKF